LGRFQRLGRDGQEADGKKATSSRQSKKKKKIRGRERIPEQGGAPSREEFEKEKRKTNKKKKPVARGRAEKAVCFPGVKKRETDLQCETGRRKGKENPKMNGLVFKIT